MVDEVIPESLYFWYACNWKTTSNSDKKTVKSAHCFTVLDNHGYWGDGNQLLKAAATKTILPELFHDEGSYHTETSPIICRAIH